MENKDKIEYAGENFINDFHERAHKLKNLSEKLDKKEIISEDLRERINGIIKGFKEGKKIPLDRAEEVNNEVREKLRFLRELALSRPSYEGIGAVIDDSYLRNSEKGSTHRALVFKVGNEVLVETGNFDLMHDDLAKMMYAHNRALLDKNGISDSDLMNNGARLYIQKVKQGRIAPKDGINNENFLKYASVFGEEELEKAATPDAREKMEEENEKLRERMLREIVSQAK